MCFVMYGHSFFIHKAYYFIMYLYSHNFYLFAATITLNYAQRGVTLA